MKSVAKNNGFSLTEVLMAVGILSVGIMLVATMFPVALYLTTVASEKTMASIVADQAFAKMRLYGIKGMKETTIFNTYWTDMNDVIAADEYTYPSSDGTWQYCWVPLCKKLNDDPCDMQYLVKLYIARKTNPNQRFYSNGILSTSQTTDRPIPINVKVVYNISKPKQLKILKSNGPIAEYINPPPSTAIVDNVSGRIFRIVSRDSADADTVILDRSWDSDIGVPNEVWLLPAAEIKGEPAGKNPDIEIYQKIIDFSKK
jgi:prepilin-type N-terminal cleavage/methylation domain-containing protein